MTAPGTQMLEGLRLLKDMPGWLRQDRLERAMRKCVPEFTSGAMTLLEARAKRIRLERASATGWFMATVEGSGSTHQIHMIGAVDRERCAAVDAVRSGAQFGEQGWRCLLPELGIVLETLPPEAGRTRADCQAAGLPPRVGRADPARRSGRDHARRPERMPAAPRPGRARGSGTRHRAARQDRAGIERPAPVRLARTTLRMGRGDGRGPGDDGATVALGPRVGGPARAGA